MNTAVLTVTVAPIVFHLARSLGGDDVDARLAVALACQATQDGHVCADLDQEAGWGPWAGALDAPRRAALRARLPALGIVGGADDWTPLVWDGRRLALRRYWNYERQVADDLLCRASLAVSLDATMEDRLADSFADAGQRQAARIALSRHLCLISGGPGTGKTTTLARMLGLMQAQNESGNGVLRIALAAPTGKAAARMAEALQAAGVAGVGAAATLHRLLGMRADGSGFYRHRERPLPVDVLVVDEASMIDLSLMAHLLAALPATARLILLGDQNQLAAVEAGAVFAHLCASPRLAACVATLTTRFRFGDDSGIGRLAECLRGGDGAGVLRLLSAPGDDLVWYTERERRDLTPVATAGYRAYREAVAAGVPAPQLFEYFRRFRILCAHRQEVAAINAALFAGDLARAAPGTPVMVTRNDSSLRVHNGDIGLLLVDPTDGQIKVCFETDDPATPVRWIGRARLPACEAAWAMTVHKAQGSEFDRVLLVLPTQVSPVLTRELVYTAVTRARSHLGVWAEAGVLKAAIERRAERMSGLAVLLG